MNQALPLSAIADLSAVIGTGYVCAMNPGSDGVVYLAIHEATAEGDDDERCGPRGWTSEGRPRPYRIVGLRDSSIVFDLVIHDVPLIVAYVDAQPDWLLLAGGRARGRNTWEEPHECNARIYARDGQFVRALALGDDIRGIQITEDGAIWVAYGCEGESHVVASELVAYDVMGAPLFQFESKERGYSIGDTDALNAAGSGDIWVASSPNDYTLIHLGRHGMPQTRDPLGTAEDWLQRPWDGALDARRAPSSAVWDLPVFDVACLAIAGRYAMFSQWGSWTGTGTTHELRLYALQVYRQFEAIGTLTPMDDDGRPIEVQGCVGRGNAIYLRSGTALYRIDIETADAACGKNQ